MKKLTLLFLSLFMCMSMAACSSTAETPSAAQYTAGTYKSTAQGMRGDITLEVTFSENEITKIDVVQSDETVMIGEKALELISEQVIENQSLAVDNISSATITSAAAKTIIADCVKQAGGDVEVLQNKVIDKEIKDETFDVDVVVVGGGLSGLTAAVKSMQSGAKVALIEKQDIIGGTSVMAEGYFFSTAEGEAEDLYNEFTRRATEAHSTQFPIDSMLHVLADNNTPALDMIRGTGCDIVPLKRLTSIAVTEEGVADPSSRSAYRLIRFLSNYITENGGMIYTATPATELVIEDGVVKGVISDSKTGKKQFNAKSTILASGDFARNQEMLNKYIPQSANCYTITAAGNTGDGITLALSAGGQVYDDMYVQGGPLIFNPNDTWRGSFSKPQFLKNSLLVSVDGDRRMGEHEGTRPVHYSYTNHDLADGAWSIMDAGIVKDLDTNIEDLIAATTDTSAIRAYKADTIFDLALAADMNPEVLIRNVDRYNALCAAGEDTDFHKPAELLDAIDEGPFYAVRGYAINRGTLGGIVTNEKAEVTDAEGNPIQGLYAAGTLSSRAFFSRTYHGGSALGISATMGFVAGTNAAESALK